MRGGPLVEEGSHGITDEELCGDNSSAGGISVTDSQGTGSGNGGGSTGGASSGANNTTGGAEMELAGPVALSTRCILLAPGSGVHGTLAITESEMFFEMDLEDDRNLRLDEKVSVIRIIITRDIISI